MAAQARCPVITRRREPGGFPAPRFRQRRAKGAVVELSCKQPARQGGSDGEGIRKSCSRGRLGPRGASGSAVAGSPSRGPAGAGGGSRRQPGRLQRLAHRRRRAVERLRRSKGRQLPHHGLCRAGASRGAFGDRPGLDGGVLRVRARPGPVADEALRASRRTHSRLLPRHLADRRPPLEHRRERTARRRLPLVRGGPSPPGGPGDRRRRHRKAGHHPAGRALSGRVPGGLLLALGRRGTGRPDWSRAIGSPPAHRRPLQRRWVVPLRR